MSLILTIDKDICYRQYLWLSSIHDTIVYRHNPNKTCFDIQILIS